MSTPPSHRRCAAMGLLHHSETQLERQIFVQLQAAFQQALDDYQPICDHCRLDMHRHHRHARAIAASYGKVRRQIPMFRCCQCRRMAGGTTLPGDEMCHQRFSKKTVTSASVWPCGEASDDVAFGAAQSGVAAAGAVGDGMWAEHNLLALLPEQGLINQTT